MIYIYNKCNKILQLIKYKLYFQRLYKHDEKEWLCLFLISHLKYAQRKQVFNRIPGFQQSLIVKCKAKQN